MRPENPIRVDEIIASQSVTIYRIYRLNDKILGQRTSFPISFREKKCRWNC